MRTYALAATVLLGVFGCDGDDSGVIDAGLIDTPPSDCSVTCQIDAPIDTPGIDGPPSSVHAVTCPAAGGIASEVTTPTFSAYAITDTTISTGDIVRFTMPSFHTATSGPVNGGIPEPDGKFRVGFSETTCLQFTAPGSFPFYCELHVFTGTLTVTDPV